MKRRGGYFLSKSDNLKQDCEWFQFFTHQTNTCWIWTGSKTGDGYGRFSSRYFKKRMRAHVFAFFMANGRLPVPFGLHHCDTPLCVRPDHIFEGDQSDNIRDKVAKGRCRNGVCLGEKNHKTKLNPDKVRQLRELYRSGIGFTNLGRNFGISRTAARDVALGRHWKHV